MTSGGEGDKGGRAAARRRGSEDGWPGARTAPERKGKCAHPHPRHLLLSPQPEQKAVTSHPSRHLAGAPRPGQEAGREGGRRRPALFVFGRRGVYAKSLEPGCTPGRRAQWLKAFLFWEVALPARPFPLPHVVQVRDTWRRRPIGSFKPRRGSGGGGGRLGKRRRRGRETMAG